MTDMPTDETPRWTYEDGVADDVPTESPHDQEPEGEDG